MSDDITVHRMALLRRFTGDKCLSAAEREAAAASLFRQFTHHLQAQLLRSLDPRATEREHEWIRRCFDEEAGNLGKELRNAVPSAERHDLAQVLQREMLDADRRLCRALKAETAQNGSLSAS